MTTPTTQGLEGLAQWLRNNGDRRWTDDPAKFARWADAVEAATPSKVDVDGLMRAVEALEDAAKEYGGDCEAMRDQEWSSPVDLEPLRQNVRALATRLAAPVQPVGQVVTIAQGRNAGKQAVLTADVPNGTLLYAAQPAEAPRMLTEFEVAQAVHDTYSGAPDSAAERLQRKFLAVNAGRTIPAAEGEPK